MAAAARINDNLKPSIDSSGGFYEFKTSLAVVITREICNGHFVVAVRELSYSFLRSKSGIDPKTQSFKRLYLEFVVARVIIDPENCPTPQSWGGSGGSFYGLAYSYHGG